MNEDSVYIYTDGGARGNPGPAACSFVASKNGVVLKKESKFLGVTTNNVAEYEGVILALNWVYKDGRNSVKFFLDSELIVRQINGVYKVKDQGLKKVYTRCRELLDKIGGEIIFRNIPRSKNKIADFLVNQELDANT